MEAFWGRFKFHDAVRGVDLEHPPTIMAIIDDMMLLAKEEERQDIGNTVLMIYTLLVPKFATLLAGMTPLLQCTWIGRRAGRTLSTCSGLENKLTVL